LCQGHHFVFTGDDVPEFLKGAIRSARFFKERVETLLTKENGNIDRVMDVIKSEEYDANASVKQPERAYQLNLRTRIEHLAARMKLPAV
ncbi:MAG TPA: hypothetical protein VHO84_09485, partial [Syntrophorhabdaceae bacterium]|nr:hypothetical protein [Syntrophorhabdaceae bacterium]